MEPDPSGRRQCALRLAINDILIPHKFLSGGFAGVALAIHYLVPALPVAWLYFVLNVPLFTLGGCRWVDDFSWTALQERSCSPLPCDGWRSPSRFRIRSSPHCSPRSSAGGTVIAGRGAYTNRPEQILYTVITCRELVRLKRLIRRVDPNTFVVVADTLEVMGLRVGTHPHW